MDPALLLVAGLAVILLLQFSRVRRQQREVRSTQAGIEVGAEVLTAAGMVGTVVGVDDAAVTLQGEDGHRTRWVRAAVIRVLPDTDPASSRYQRPAEATDGTAPTDPTSTPASDSSSDAVDDDGSARNQD